MYPDTLLQEHLESIDACDDAREWAGKRTATQAWKACTKPEWLVWWARRTNANSLGQKGEIGSAYASIEYCTCCHCDPKDATKKKLLAFIRKTAKQPWIEPKPAKKPAAKKKKLKP